MDIWDYLENLPYEERCEACSQISTSFSEAGQPITESSGLCGDCKPSLNISDGAIWKYIAEIPRGERCQACTKPEERGKRATQNFHHHISKRGICGVWFEYFVGCCPYCLSG